MIDWNKIDVSEYKVSTRTFSDWRRQMVEWRDITVGFTGHRSDRMGGFQDKLGGYDNKHPIVLKLKVVLFREIEALILKGKIQFIFGGALGFDTLAFWVTHDLKKKYPHIKLIVAIPFKNQEKQWVKQKMFVAVKWYFRMLKVADEVIDVARSEGYETHEDPQIPIDDFSIKKMNVRNKFMVDPSGTMIAFFNGERKSGTSSCINYIKSAKSGHRAIIGLIDPRFDFSFEWC
jgi:uncharacterized phage-like protein YoqJ